MTSSQLQNLCESLVSSSHRIYGWTNTLLLSVPIFFQLLQLRRVRRSLDDAPVATLMHAFVTSRVDYCNCLLAGATKALLDKLQRIMNAAARVVSESDTHKFDRGLTSIRRNDLHWLDVPGRVTFRLHTRHGTAIPAGTVPADPQHRRTPSTALSDSR